MTTNSDKPVAVRALDLPARTGSAYPEPFASRVGEREKRALGDVFGLSTFGTNLTRLAPGAMSALRHAHRRQDELIYILEGHPTLITDAGETRLSPGDCAGFAAGTGDAHHLVNRSEADVLYMEIGGRETDERVTYPDDDLIASNENGRWRFSHKDGSNY